MPLTKPQIVLKINSDVRNKTTPYSISNIDVADILADILDYAEANSSGLIQIDLTADGSFNMDAKRKLNSVSFQNNSPGDMDLILNYVIAGNTTPLPNITVTTGKTLDLDIGTIFWIGGTVNISGVTGALTLLIDRI